MRYLAIIVLLLAGCQAAPRPLKPGVISVSGGEVFLQQSENPLTPATVEVSPISVLHTRTLGTEATFADDLGQVVEGYSVKVTLGSSQEDTSREIAAKLSSMKAVQYAGITLILVGIGAFFVVRNAWPTNAFIILAGSVGAGISMIAISIWMPQVSPWLGLGLLGVLIFVPVIAYVYYKTRNEQIESKSPSQ